MPDGKETEANLWNYVYRAFPYPDKRVKAEVNRIAAKCLIKAIGNAGPGTFDPSTCDVRSERIPGEELPALIRYHSRAKITRRTTPIIIIQVDDKRVVIEGNYRVNRMGK